ncbi:MAG: hypothetical protein ABIR70_18250 [Bryobacteraceae bacterium]
MRLVLAFLLASSAFAADCDRACLKTTLDQYLNAVIKHDPTAAPLVIGFRQTDNAVVVKPGTGVWKSVTGLGKLQRRFMDTVSGQAAYFGIVTEGDKSAIVTVRVKVENRKITEAEWYLSRPGDPGMNGFNANGTPNGNFFEPDNLLMNAPPERVVPKDQRASRETLLAITNSYFDGLTTHDGSIILHHDGCSRIENGRTMTTQGDCAANLAGLNVSIVAARRYPVVDEEAQVALAFGVFLRKPGTAQRRNAFSEWFFIDANKIHNIYAAFFFPTPDVPVPNWPPYDGNFQPPAELAPRPAPAPAK